MKHKFKILLKVADEFIIHGEHTPKGVNKWVEIYDNTPQAQELSIFERHQDTYTLVDKMRKVPKRRIGF